ncbi:BON domain-containing protein [Candidatus Bathyarchaeota archaeon]|nr:BON domain-containing protein [Candidatus Bathyarchaeota archaeon]
MTATTQRADESIKKDIVDELYWDGRVDASNVEVTVDDGKVNLSGHVPTRVSRFLVFEDTWSVKGTRAVKNDIKVKLPEGAKKPTDEEVKHRIEEFLSWEHGLNEDVNVKVRDSIVTLSGTVGSYWQKDAAEDATNKVNGVLDVENLISIAPTDNLVDEVIAEGIVNAMDRNVDVDAEDIDVKVEQGKVTLGGSIPSYWAWRAAIRAVSNANGVVELEDHLVISP